MALQTFPFNNTDGTTITTGNSGAASVTISASCTAQYKAAAAYQGSTGAEFTVASTGFSNAQFNLSASTTQVAVSIRFKIPATIPSAAQTPLQINDSSGARILQLQYTAGGTVKTNDKANTGITLLTSAQATPGSWFRFELVISALSATTGAFTARAYSTGSTQVGSTASSTTANLGTTNINGVTIGVLASGQVYTVDLDSLQMNGGSTTEIGEYSSNSTPPTVVAGANQTIAAPGSSVNLTCTATPAGGSAGIASYQWTPLSWPVGGSAPTITNPTSQTASFTPAVTGRYVFGVTATDLEGNTSAQASTKVFLPDVQIQVIEVTSNTGFTVGAIASDLSDGSDSTYIDSGSPGSGNVLLARLKPLISTGTGFSLDIRSYVTAVSGTQKVALLEGSTVRKDWGTVSPGTSAGDIILTLSTAEMATIGSWNELDLRFTQV